MNIIKISSLRTLFAVIIHVKLVISGEEVRHSEIVTVTEQPSTIITSIEDERKGRNLFDDGNSITSTTQASTTYSGDHHTLSEENYESTKEYEDKRILENNVTMVNTMSTENLEVTTISHESTENVEQKYLENVESSTEKSFKENYTEKQFSHSHSEENYKLSNEKYEKNRFDGLLEDSGITVGTMSRDNYKVTTISHESTENIEQKYLVNIKSSTEAPMEKQSSHSHSEENYELSEKNYGDTTTSPTIFNTFPQDGIHTHNRNENISSTLYETVTENYTTMYVTVNQNEATSFKNNQPKSVSVLPTSEGTTQASTTYSGDHHTLSQENYESNKEYKDKRFYEILENNVATANKMSTENHEVTTISHESTENVEQKYLENIESSTEKSFTENYTEKQFSHSHSEENYKLSNEKYEKNRFDGLLEDSGITVGTMSTENYEVTTISHESTENIEQKYLANVGSSTEESVIEKQYSHSHLKENYELSEEKYEDTTTSPTIFNTFPQDKIHILTIAYNRNENISSTPYETVTENFTTMYVTVNQNEATSFKNKQTKSVSVLPTCEVLQFEMNIVDITISEVTTQFVILTDSGMENCNLTLYINCTSTENDTNSDETMASQVEKFKIVEGTSVCILKNLSELTDYTCFCELKNGKDNLLNTLDFNFTTLQSVPSDVNFSIVDMNSTTINITWDRPQISGKLKNYYVIIKNGGPKHFIREECRSDNETDFYFSYYTKNDRIFYNFDIEPDYEYEIQILAENEAGNSTGIPNRIVTNSSYSTVAMNITSELIVFSNNCNGSEYNATLLIKWVLPCNTNGQLDKFKIYIKRTAHDNSSNFQNETILKNYDIENIFYELYVSNLEASSEYSFRIIPITEEDIEGVSSENNIVYTPDGCPAEPSIINVLESTSSGFTVDWKEPHEYYGNIEGYEVAIRSSKPRHFTSEDGSCEKITPLYLLEKVNESFFSFVKGMPNLDYTMKIRAQTAVGLGRYSRPKIITTNAKASDPVREMEIAITESIISNETYKLKVQLAFKEPCNTNGPFEYYSIKYDDELTYQIRDHYLTLKEFTLSRPDYNYIFEIRVKTESFESSITRKSILTDAGVPPVYTDQMSFSINKAVPTQVDLVFNKKIFGEGNGEVKYYAIFLMKTKIDNFTYFPHGFWNNRWPLANDTLISYGKPEDILQLTSDYWNPFKGGINQVLFSIGKTQGCTSLHYCETLMEDTEYTIVLRGLTRTSYREIFTVVKTGKNSNIGLVLALMCLCLLFIVIGIFLYQSNRKNLWIKFRRISESSIVEEIPRHAISVKHFISYYNKITNDPTLLKKQYEEIEDESKNNRQFVNTTFAMKLENKRKNRYTNIIPFDEHRVKLNIDEDDEISSDYINASFIKGYSGEVEYIATQGPLEHTCKDFWKMVIQENVTVIVMVTQFVEKEKEKCFRYFPNNHETMLISEDIEVKCQVELQFDTYCVRTLLVRKDIRQYTVIHMQFLDWPDFGCPSGTNAMLFFCQEVRDRIQLEQGLMVVHCSAGVGRTGTLISLDILLQSIKNKKRISVFETVVALRRQRTHMVQTEKQYVYIHTCLKDALENATLYLCDDLKTNAEHIYNNIPKKPSELEHGESTF